MRQAGAIVLICLAVIIEARVLGWEKSSIKRALVNDTVSTRADWFYTILYASNISAILGFVFTLGIVFYVGTSVRAALDVNLLSDTHPIIGLTALLFSHSLAFYWFHRILHTGFLWGLHKTHHAADDLIIITNFRSHPLDASLKPVAYLIPAVALGVSPEVTLIYFIFAGFLVLMQHSNMDWNMPFVEKYIFIGSKGHRIHHSKFRYHNYKNLGYLVLWDWVFGTLYHTYEKTLTGLDSREDLKGIHNPKNLGRGLWGVYVESLRASLLCVSQVGFLKRNVNK